MEAVVNVIRRHGNYNISVATDHLIAVSLHVDYALGGTILTASETISLKCRESKHDRNTH